MGGGGGRKRNYAKKTLKVAQSNFGTGGSLFGNDDGCLSLSFSTRLQNITPALNDVRINQDLPIDLTKNGTQISPIVLNYNREVCGFIVHVRMHQLIECLQKGIRFVAHVTNKNNNICDVQVRSVGA